MIKTLFKLLLIIIAGYILVQIPFIREQVDGFKASISEKWNNVTSEAKNVQDKFNEVKTTVGEIKVKAENAKKSYDELKTQVIQTKDAMTDAATKLNKAVEAFSGSEATAGSNSQ
ncbi:MAG: hypothetical protein V1908_02450 [Candidatus Peregrinibacteria bacterium]